MELGCDPTITGVDACSSAQIAYLNNFRDQMLEKLAGLIYSEFGGAFLPECFIHVVQDVDGAWNGIRVGGQTQVETFTAWYNGVTTKEKVVFDGVWGSNPTCSLYQAEKDTKGIAGVQRRAVAI